MNIIFLLFWFVFCSLDSISLWSPGCPGILTVDQADLQDNALTQVDIQEITKAQLDLQKVSVAQVELQEITIAQVALQEINVGKADLQEITIAQDGLQGTLWHRLYFNSHCSPQDDRPHKFKGRF